MRGAIALRSFLRAQREIAGCLGPETTPERAAAGFLSGVRELFGWEQGHLWRVSLDSGRLDSAAEPVARRAKESGRIEWLDGPEGIAIALPIPVGTPSAVVAVAVFTGPGPAPSSSGADGDPRSALDEAEEVLTSLALQFDSFLRSDPGDTHAERVRQHMAEVVRGTQDAVLSKDLEGIVTTWNPAAERLYGYSAEEAVGQHISFLVPFDHEGEEIEILDRVRRGERLETYETERIRADGTRIDVSLTISPIMSSTHNLIGASVIARDITVEKRRRAAEAFLVAASRKLDASLDLEETARTIVNTAVPEVAEICVIDFVRPDGSLGDSVAACVEPGLAERIERVRGEAPVDPDGEHPSAQVLRSGMPMTWRNLNDPDVADSVAQSEEHRRMMSEAGYHSAAIVPLVARGRTLGILAFAHAAPDRRFDAEDLAFVSELGDRAAMALDNARLFEERDRIAQDLQRGLRPPVPPEVPGLEISVVFEPAGEGVEIGGDFYDVIPTEDGCWLLIGDVAGKGSAAAGVSVSVRHAVRGLSREMTDPAEILTRVNELLHEGDTLHDFATTELIRMRRDGDGWELRVAAAGHPPAIHIAADGASHFGGGTILGAWREPRLELHDSTLGDGESLILSTDGWYEVGPVAEHRRPECFAAMAHEHAGAELDELTGRLREDAVERAAGSLKDDMIILGVRPA